MPFQNKKAYKLVLAAILCGIALVLALLDNMLSSLLPFIPGVKLGLANIVSMFAIYYLGFGYAIVISIVRCLLAAFLSGNMTMLLYSLSGGLISIIFMYAFRNYLSKIKVSIIGALTHNITQIMVSVIMLQTTQIAYYLPFLTITGTISGFFMGFLCSLVFRQINKSPIWPG